MQMSITGVGILADKMDKLADKLGKENVEPIVLAGADKLRKYIRKAAPRGKTGNLQRGQIRKLLPRKSEYPVVALIRPQYSIAPHSHLVEHGHAGPAPARAHPFFYPTVEAHMQEIQDEIIAKIKGEIEQI